jgi:hypothetical protein
VHVAERAPLTVPDDAPPYAALPPRYDVFLSHRRGDSADFARVLKGYMIVHGYKVRQTKTQVDDRGRSALVVRLSLPSR